MKKKEIDAIDLHILRILASKSNIMNKDLAQMIGLTPAPSSHRVDNLKKRGYLLDSSTAVNYAKLGFPNSTGFIAQYFSTGEENIIEPLLESPKVITLIDLSCTDDYRNDIRWILAILVGRDRPDLNATLKKIELSSKIVSKIFLSLPNENDARNKE